MIRKLFVAVLGFASVFVCAQTEGNRLLHTCYTTDGSLQSAERVAKSDYGKFEYMYIMAAPAWTPEDMDLPTEAMIDKLVTKHKANPLVTKMIDQCHKTGTKVLLCLLNNRFLEVGSVAERRASFARMIAAYVDKYNFDGVDLDWEVNIDINLHYELMKELRAELQKVEDKTKTKMYLTTALHSGHRYGLELATNLSAITDWINIMTYDMGGGDWGREASHNTPLDAMKAVLVRWDVFPRQKLCIGLANYAYCYKGIAPNQKNVSLKDVGYSRSWHQIPELIKAGWFEEYDTVSEVPYYFSPDRTEFLTADNHRSLDRKMEWVKAQNYRGVFWWQFYHDFELPKNGEKYGTHHLIDYVQTQIVK